MITCQKADPNPEGRDSRLLWEWRMDPVTRQMSLTTEVIPWESHKTWYEKAVVDPRRVILIASVDGRPACMVRFDSAGADRAEISLNMNPALRGQGLGKPVLAEACAHGFGVLKLSRISAQIRAGNARSIRIFEAVGFVFAGEQEGVRTYYLERPDVPGGG